ncbi:hypothetical protein [Chroococcidiopsis sp. CCMEE 29]|uniref:hypothetical protein n=1 Tax=Chroococcidiopsis sp. CCMEE 29 TaxID=155894 RepID=UPI002020FBEC|nr:hypothetical protein [Chroococcidiopsis sp. CCMEE 29]
MLKQAWDTTANCAIALLMHYIFDLGGYSAAELVNRWLDDYPVNWVRLAVIEALYQGRYKAISVEQILYVWHRREQALPHFNHEFERLVCGDLYQTLIEQSNPTKSYPLALKPVVSFRNGHHGANIITTVGTSKQTSVQHVNTTVNVPVTKQVGGASRQIKSHQSSNNDRRRSPSNHSAHSLSSGSQPPIRQFNPVKTDTSDFYTKLKAISQHTEN